MDAVTAIVVALLTVGGSLLGVLAGWRLGMSERLRQWRRDKQIDAYSELLSASADVAGAASHELQAETNEEHAEAGRETGTAMLRYHDALHRTNIVAAPSVQLVIAELAKSMSAGIHELHNRENRDDEVISEHLVAAANLRKRVSEAARTDLGFDR
ncbi:MAG TPA: hypothetical protein VGU71_04205 [Candidatus Dormibacteraeota bacterium]|nr:hypothetical protein [Candidatus Dormibacteraeota bacterium]